MRVDIGPSFGRPRQLRCGDTGAVFYDLFIEKNMSEFRIYAYNPDKNY